MFENIGSFFRRIVKPEQKELGSKDAAKERLHLVLMQDRANVSADFLDLMREEIIEVIKKYIDIDEEAMDVRLTNKENEDGTQGAPALYANIPIVNIKDETRKISNDKKVEDNTEEKKDVSKEEKSEKKDKEEKNKDCNTDADNEESNDDKKENIRFGG